VIAVHPTLRLVGRVRLSARQQRIWLTFAGAVPGGVTTVEQLLQWVRAHKALIAAKAPDGVGKDQLAALDALFEWCTGVDMPDPPSNAARASQPTTTIGKLTCHVGGRIELERELLALILADKSDGERAREIADRLDRRGAPKVV
jgi:hypothetical protein